MEVNSTLVKKILVSAGAALAIGLGFYYFFRSKPAPSVPTTPKSVPQNLTKE